MRPSTTTEAMRVHFGEELARLTKGWSRFSRDRFALQVAAGLVETAAFESATDWPVPTLAELIRIAALLEKIGAATDLPPAESALN